jgi:hypothetical protein
MKSSHDPNIIKEENPDTEQKPKKTSLVPGVARKSNSMARKRIEP